MSSVIFSVESISTGDAVIRMLLPTFSIVCAVPTSSLIYVPDVVGAGAVALFRCFFCRHSMYHPMREVMSRRLMTPRMTLRMSGSFDGAAAEVGVAAGVAAGMEAGVEGLLVGG